jgi:hypothetical protein
MASLVRFELPDNGYVWIEAEEVPEGYGRRDVAGEVGGIPVNLERAVKTVSKVAEIISDNIRQGFKQSKEIEVEVAVKFSMEGDIIIAKGQAEGNWKIKIKW